MMTRTEKHRVRNVLAFRRDCARRPIGRDPLREWKIEIANHVLVPFAARDAGDRFLIRFAQRQLHTPLRDIRTYNEANGVRYYGAPLA